MQPTPRATPASNDELRVVQARLYRLLVEAQDRLARERGLTRFPTAAEQSQTNRETDGFDTSSDKASNSKA